MSEPCVYRPTPHVLLSRAAHAVGDPGEPPCVTGLRGLAAATHCAGEHRSEAWSGRQGGDMPGLAATNHCAGERWQVVCLLLGT